MDLKQNKRAAVVGVFIFLAVIIFVAGVFMVGGGGSLLSKKAQVKAVFDDIKGLKSGNNVWFSGVKVGTIKSADFNPDGSVLVTMGIDEDAKKFIPKNVQAKVSTDGLVGNKIIMLIGGTPQAGSIQGGETLSIAKDVDTEHMMATLQKNNENLVTITENIKVLTDQIASGKGTAGKLLFDETLFNNLQATIAEANQTAINAGNVTGQLASYTAKLNDKGTITNELVTDTVLFSSLKRSAKQMEKASSSFTTITSNFESASEGLKDGTSPAGVLLTDKEAADNLKEILENLNKSSKKMDETLEAAQHSIFLRGFFKRKAKEEAAAGTKQ
ncbi:MAG TPA: MlaD family protein [Sphingobacteriaceae bacterium]